MFKLYERHTGTVVRKPRALYVMRAAAALGVVFGFTFVLYLHGSTNSIAIGSPTAPAHLNLNRAVWLYLTRISVSPRSHRTVLYNTVTPLGPSPVILYISGFNSR
jgi:hypothetical protein